MKKAGGPPIIPIPTMMPTPPNTPLPKNERRGAIAVVPRGDRLLVIRRSAHVIAPGAYCFPGGGIEAEESETEALVRELDEELGVAVRPVRRLWQSVTAWHVHLAWWLADLPEDAKLFPNAAEVEATFWLTVDEMRRLPDLLPSNHEFIEAMESGIFTIDGF